MQIPELTMAYRHSTKVLSRQRDVSEDVCASLTDRAEAQAASPGLSRVVRVTHINPAQTR